MQVSELLRGASEVLTVKEDDDLGLARQMMAWARIRHLPVVRDGRVVGVVSQTDILRHGSGGSSGGGVKVGAAMSRPAEVTTPQADVSEVCARMLDRRVGCLPVVEDEVLVGIITTSDILASRAHQPRRSPGPRSLSVADAMTRAPQTARPEDSLREAIHRMSRAGIRHLPVVDDRFHVLGILSDRDIRNVVGDVAEADQAEEPNAEIAFQLQVAEVMTAPALTVNQAENLREVMGDLIDQRVGAFAVTDHEDHLVGILSYVDVLTALYHQG